MKNYTLLFLSFFITAYSAHAQFQECNSPTTKSLKDVYFMDANAGIAVGDSGIIIQTLDGGLNWNIAMENDTVNFNKIRFFDNQIGIAVGSDIYRTEDGGSSWNPISSLNHFHLDIEILDDNTCIVSGSPNRLLKSSNKGLDWDILLSDTSEHEIGMLSFIDENIGYSIPASLGVINSTLKTIDGGSTWIEIEDASGQHITLIEDVSFVSEEKGFRGGWYSPHLMKTENSSLLWESPNIPNSLNLGFGIYNFHIEKTLPNSYYFCGWYGDIFKSTDGGSNWIKLETDIGNIILYSIYFIDDNNGWVVGEYGKIFKTDNGGGTVGWNDLDKNFNISIYPNPTKSNLIISTNGNLKIEQISIIDNNGKFLFSKKNSNSIDLSYLPNGIYYLEIKTNRGTQTKKIVKE